MKKSFITSGPVFVSCLPIVIFNMHAKIRREANVHGSLLAKPLTVLEIEVNVIFEDCSKNK